MASKECSNGLNTGHERASWARLVALTRLSRRNNQVNQIQFLRGLQHSFPELYSKLVAPPSAHAAKFRPLKFLKSYFKIVDMLPVDPALWPGPARRTRKFLLATHLKHTGRIHLVGFLLRNGVGPELIMEYLHYSASLRDDAAVREIWNLCMAWLAGDLRSSDYDLFSNSFVPRTAGVPHIAYTKYNTISNDRHPNTRFRIRAW